MNIPFPDRFITWEEDEAALYLWGISPTPPFSRRIANITIQPHNIITPLEDGLEQEYNICLRARL